VLKIQLVIAKEIEGFLEKFSVFPENIRMAFHPFGELFFIAFLSGLEEEFGYIGFSINFN